MNKHILIIALSSLLWLNACTDSENPEPDPIVEEQEITFNIDHRIYDDPISWISGEYILPAGNEVIIHRVSYILSDFFLVDKGGDTVFLDGQYAMIDGRTGPMSVTLTEVPKGMYASLGFSMGLVPEVNHADPNQYPVDHPLSPVRNALHWSWSAGYIFIAVQGSLVSTNESYVYHIAGDNNRVDYAFSIPFEKGDAALTTSAVFHFEKIFEDPTTFDMEKDGMTTHTTTDPVTTALVANMHNLFTIETIQ